MNNILKFINWFFTAKIIIVDRQQAEYLTKYCGAKLIIVKKKKNP